MCGGVPCGKPMRNPVTDGLMLVGDAAHQINPMTGGGIVSGMKAGWIAGQVAAEAIIKENYSVKMLNNYSDAMWKAFGKNYERFYKIKEAVHNLSDEDLDYIAEKVLSIPHNKRTLSSVFKAAVFKKPALIIDVLKVFAGV
jgi:digeranylgeranylglycerophospholipid reductase